MLPLSLSSASPETTWTSSTCMDMGEERSGEANTESRSSPSTSTSRSAASPGKEDEADAASSSSIIIISSSSSSSSSSNSDEESSDDDEGVGWPCALRTSSTGLRRRIRSVTLSPAFSKSSSQTTHTSPRYLGKRGVIRGWWWWWWWW